MLFLVTLTTAACGGSSGSEQDDEGSRPDATEEQPSGDSESDASSTGVKESSDDDSPALGEAKATVTFDGETYRFGHTTFVGEICAPDLFGIFRLHLLQVDDAGEEHPSGSDLLIELLHEDADPDVVESTDARDRVTLSIADAGEEWIADADEIELRGLDPGTSQVDDYTIDGNSASGTATFFELGSEGEYFTGNADSYLVAQATFEVTCAE